jgi:hypothetical protein
MSYHLAILHHHLNRGGVTQVIANHLRALDAVGGGPERVLLLYGGRRTGWPEDLPGQLSNLDVQLCEVPELDYDDSPRVEPGALADRLSGILSDRGCGAEETIVHAHNHSLGKNLSLPGAIGQLAATGYRLLLQIHDFAEDFRPHNYRRQLEGFGATSPQELGQRMYPQAGQIHYAVLNGRDRSILARARVTSDRVHLLPNPVHEFGEMPEKTTARAKLDDRFGITPETTFLLYPVRGIRRKNVGEALLWSALFESGVTLGLTLRPINPIEQPHYDRWVRLAEELSLPIRFGLGEDGGLGFTENLSAADAVLTTSVAEGFGMVFLETWLAERMLLGRDLPEITTDFKAAGLKFATLSPELRIPVDWIDEHRFMAEFEAAYRHVLDEYGQQTESPSVAQAIQRLIVDGTVDFASLSSELQEQAIRHVAADSRQRDDLLTLNPWIAASVEGVRRGDAELIAHNAAAVRDFISLEVSGRRLKDLYDMVRRSDASSVEGLGHGKRILEEFLDVSRFHPVRVES